MIATNLPALRLLFVSFLQNKNSENIGYGSQDRSGPRSGIAQSHALVSVVRRGDVNIKGGKEAKDIEAGRDTDGSWENFDDNSSSKAIVQHTTVSVTSERGI